MGIFARTEMDMQPEQMNTAAILPLLEFGSMEIEGLLPWSSNYSFLVRVCPNEQVANAIGKQAADSLNEVRAVYKPRRGERPLWDFPQGTLYQRERAAFVVSDALSWQQVPPTVIRHGSHGVGSVQLFIEHDPDCHYFTIEGDHHFQEQLQKIVLFDIIINNADRKAGHVLIEEPAESSAPGDRLWLIDHGICFHVEHKLRTVIWEFAGQTIPVPLLKNMTAFLAKLANQQSKLHKSLANLLSRQEVKTLQLRTKKVIDQDKFITPGPGRHYPWPPV